MGAHPAAAVARVDRGAAVAARSRRVRRSTARSESSSARSARDNVLAQAVRVAIARRYEDAAALDAAWSEARDSVLHIEADLFLLLPLAELVTAAARVGDTARLQPHFARALEIVAAARLAADLVGAPALGRHPAGNPAQPAGRPQAARPRARGRVAAQPDRRGDGAGRAGLDRHARRIGRRRRGRGGRARARLGRPRLGRRATGRSRREPVDRSQGLGAAAVVRARAAPEEGVRRPPRDDEDDEPAATRPPRRASP